MPLSGGGMVVLNATHVVNGAVWCGSCSSVVSMLVFVCLVWVDNQSCSLQMELSLSDLVNGGWNKLWSFWRHFGCKVNGLVI